MARFHIAAATCGLLLPLLTAQIAEAQNAAPLRFAGGPKATPIQASGPRIAHDQHAYPQLDAPMNPVPRANIPIQMGATMVTNQAFAPHEMLYAHRYRALYPPYFFKVKGSWMWTPFGMRSNEKWKLQGTMVDVKYHSKVSFFANWHAPLIR